MRSTVGPHGIFDFAICKDCSWTVTVLNSELYQESVCPMCFGIIDRVPMVETNEAKVVDYLSACINIESQKNDSGIAGHDSWMIEEFLPHVSWLAKIVPNIKLFFFLHGLIEYSGNIIFLSIILLKSFK